ncbi:hypothetical protein KIPB_000103 [Kipferlia bialata]|uniref:Uncharacterized protein n=1 Tax=Kipferlia bialata TaxID=797122 RepID=A0A9K3CLS2_9EUKA|nr:hypothetical protein KIPB_000103 [Kipferlia bialata]|eukprot:g103.t1
MELDIESPSPSPSSEHGQAQLPIGGFPQKHPPLTPAEEPHAKRPEADDARRGAEADSARTGAEGGVEAEEAGARVEGATHPHQPQAALCSKHHLEVRYRDNTTELYLCPECLLDIVNAGHSISKIPAGVLPERRMPHYRHLRRRGSWTPGDLARERLMEAIKSEHEHPTTVADLTERERHQLSLVERHGENWELGRDRGLIPEFSARALRVLWDNHKEQPSPLLYNILMGAEYSRVSANLRTARETGIHHDVLHHCSMLVAEAHTETDGEGERGPTPTPGVSYGLTLLATLCIGAEPSFRKMAVQTGMDLTRVYTAPPLIWEVCHLLHSVVPQLDMDDADHMQVRDYLVFAQEQTRDTAEHTDTYSDVVYFTESIGMFLDTHQARQRELEEQEREEMEGVVGALESLKGATDTETGPGAGIGTQLE